MNVLRAARQSPAMVLATVALVFAIVGTAIAGPDAISSRITKAKTKTIAKKQAKKYFDANIGGASVANATNANTATNANALGGTSPNGFIKYGSTIPSGTTLTGAFGSLGSPAAGGGATSFQRETVSLPAKPPVELTDATVNFSPGTFGGDDDPACTGTADNPTAPAGKVCLYGEDSFGGTTANSGTGEGSAFVGSNSGFGFGVTAQGTNFGGIVGTWAYTAP